MARAVDQREGGRAERGPQVLHHGDGHVGDRHGEDRRVVRKDAEQPFGLQPGDQGEDRGGDRHHPQSRPDHLGHAPDLPGAEGLGDHRPAGGGNGLGHHADHPLQLAGDAGHGHRRRAVGVHIGIDEEHRKRHRRGLDHHGNPQGDQRPDHLFSDAEMAGLKVKIDFLPLAVQQAQRENEADRLANHRSQGRAQRAHPQGADKQQVQHDVDHRGDGDKLEGMPGVPHATHDGRNQVITVDEHDAQHAGNAVLPRILPDFRRGVQPADDVLIDQQEHHQNHHGQAHQQGEQGADHLPDQVLALLPHVAGNQDLPGVGKAHGDKGDQHQHLAADGHGGQALRAHEMADHHHVDHVVHHLQEAGQQQRRREPQHGARHASDRQVLDDSLLFLHTVPPFNNSIPSAW